MRGGGGGAGVATYDIVNGWLSKPLTLCPLHDVSVEIMRTWGQVAPENTAGVRAWRCKLAVNAYRRPETARRRAR